MGELAERKFGQCPNLNGYLHNQGWAKVNAPVDEELVELIETLGQFPGMQTVESCQGDEEHNAWVCFVFGSYWINPWQELAGFVLGFLGPKLADKLGDIVHVSIQVSSCGKIRGELEVRPGAIVQTLKALRQLLRSYRTGQLGCKPPISHRDQAH